MSDPLHPLTLSEILDRTAQIYRARFWVYFGIGALPVAVLVVFVVLAVLLISWAGPSAAGTAPAVAVVLGVALLALIALPVWLGATALGWGAVSHAAARSFLGESVSIRSAYRAVWTRGWSYVGLYLLLGLILVAAPVVLLAGGFLAFAALQAMARIGGAEDTVAAFAGFGIVALALVLFGIAFWLLLRLSLAFPAAVVEEMGPWRAIKRANALSLGTRGRIFLLFLLGAALGWILSLGAFVPMAIIIALIPASNAPQNSELVSRILAFSWYGFSFAVQAVIRPIYGIALTLFYFDQRMRTEGFDIEWQMRQAGLESAHVAAAADAAIGSPSA